MKFLDDVKVSLGEYNPSLLVKLASGWEEAAKRFPKDDLPNLLKNEIDIANRILHYAKLKQTIEIRTGEHGLEGISLTPDRAGIDLQPEQDSYVSHNLSTNIHTTALLPIVLRYIKYLELIA